MNKDLADGYSIHKWWRSVPLLLRSKSEKVEPSKEDRLRSHVHHILFNISWIGLFLLKGGFTLDEGWNFLFGIDQSFSSDNSLYFTKSEVWHMHTGIVTIVGIIMFSVLLITRIRAFINLKKGIQESGPGGVCID